MEVGKDHIIAVICHIAKSLYSDFLQLFLEDFEIHYANDIVDYSLGEADHFHWYFLQKSLEYFEYYDGYRVGLGGMELYRSMKLVDQKFR